MNLRATTRKLISRLEEKSGYPVQIVEDKKLPVFASLRIARAEGLPTHILSFNAPPPNRFAKFTRLHHLLAMRSGFAFIRTRVG